MLIPLYLAPIVLFGHWIEVRLLLSLYPVLLALALAHVEPLLEEPGTPGR